MVKNKPSIKNLQTIASFKHDLKKNFICKHNSNYHFITLLLFILSMVAEGLSWATARLSLQTTVLLKLSIP